MKRYSIAVLVRSNADEGPEGAEATVNAVNVTAANELTARRMVLERAYQNHMLVSEFVKIEVTANV